MDKKSIWESYRFPLILLVGIVVGALLGVILGEKGHRTRADWATFS